jgi:hypothetical protein
MQRATLLAGLLACMGLSALGACRRHNPLPRQQLTNCQAISRSGQELRRCLILKYDWNSDSAVSADYAFQRGLDSLTAEHRRQVEALQAAAESAYVDSLRGVAAAAIARRAAVIDRILAAGDTTLLWDTPLGERWINVTGGRTRNPTFVISQIEDQPAPNAPRCLVARRTATRTGIEAMLHWTFDEFHRYVVAAVDRFGVRPQTCPPRHGIRGRDWP